MPKSVFTGDHRHLVDVLTAARKSAGLKQSELAAKIGKDQSYISLVEGGQRRVDVLEFYVLAKALGRDPVGLYAELVALLPETISI